MESTRILASGLRFPTTLTRSQRSVLILGCRGRCTSTPPPSFENGLLSVERIAELVGQPAGALEAEFTAMGIVPPEDEPDY